MNTETIPAGWAYTHTFARHGRKYGHYSRTVRLDAEELSYFQEIAEKMGMSLEWFLQRWFDHELPKQEHHLKRTHRSCPATPLDFVPKDLLRRLHRAAEFWGKDMRTMILEDLEQTAELLEQDMVFQPETGEIVADRSSFDCLNYDRSEPKEAP